MLLLRYIQLDLRPVNIPVGGEFKAKKLRRLLSDSWGMWASGWRVGDTADQDGSSSTLMGWRHIWPTKRATTITKRSSSRSLSFLKPFDVWKNYSNNCSISPEDPYSFTRLLWTCKTIKTRRWYHRTFLKQNFSLYEQPPNVKFRSAAHQYILSRIKPKCFDMARKTKLSWNDR